MWGNRIKKAKEALVYFLKSLPEGCYFNIYSFGSNYSTLYSQSKKVDSEIIKSTINKVDCFEADFGGTEIAKPLHKIY